MFRLWFICDIFIPEILSVLKIIVLYENTNVIFYVSSVS